MKAALDCLAEGGLFGTFIDWRGLPTVHAAATQLGLVSINLIVWAKTNAGMGSLSRSQHELLPLLKKDKGDHRNNIDLGRKGRWRSNLWVYPGASSIGSDARKGLRDHPTAKPTALLEDAFLNVTARGELAMPDQKSSKPSDYLVCYRRPPKATRFTAGNSGNPKGRPKGSKNFSTLFVEELAQIVTLTENGKRKKMPKRQALAKQLVNKALGNDPKAAALVLGQIRRIEGLGGPVQHVNMNMTADEFEAIAKWQTRSE